jgi:L-arabinokinase
MDSSSSSSSTSATESASLLSLEPVPALLARTRAELGADFDPSKPMRVSRAPGRLDVMGGIADYTGSLVCQFPLDRAAAVAIQPRADRQFQCFSFNLFDAHRPFTFRMPLDALASHSPEVLRREFDEPGRKWAAYLAGCLFVLHERGFIDLRDPRIAGLNLAVLSTVPLGAGVSSSAAIEVAAMMALRDYFDLTHPAVGRSLRVVNGAAQGSAREAGQRSVFGPMDLAELCQSAENRIVGAPCGIMDQVTSCLGSQGRLLRLRCQPHQLQPDLAIPPGMRFIGIDSNVRHEVFGAAYARTRCAAFMAHRLILEKMRQIGASAGRRLAADPMRGYLANLDPDDYKRIFRPTLPQQMTGRAFIDQFGQTIDAATLVEPEVTYEVQHAADHHVLEARRVRNFATFLEEAATALDPRQRGGMLDRAGHLMYASHQSYSMDAMLGAPECDLLVDLVRRRERAGFYGARITGGGSGGTVAVLAEIGPRTDAALAKVLQEYEHRTGRSPEAFVGTSPGAWHVGTAVV